MISILPWTLRNVQLDAGLFLQVADDAEKIPRLRITTRTKHAHQALRLRASRFAKFLEADCCLDVVARDRLAVSIRQQASCRCLRVEPFFPA
jgi:hypothetical protein